MISANLGFNPCFLGTCPRRRRKSTMMSLWGECFNPCFLGTCPRREVQAGHISKVIGFQSLFSWNLPSKPERPSFPANWPLCFNPCFLGTCPRRGSQILGGHPEWVSILVFLELALEAQFFEAPDGTRVLFQSLFSWNLPSKGPEMDAFLLKVVVSILVFLELALEERRIFALFLISQCQTGLFSPSFWHE